MAGKLCTRSICRELGCRGYKNCGKALELREKVHEAVQGEIDLLAKELNVVGCGARFAAVVDQITKAVTDAVTSGDWNGVQRIIDTNKQSK